MYYHIGIAHRFDPESVLHAYLNGFFPMGEEDGTIHWIVSDPRFVLPIGGLHVPKSLARLDRRRPFEFRVDTEFRRVMELCAVGRPDENPAWILPRMIDVYTELHREGFAHSVEAWLGGVLVGGLYGVSIGGAFFGESMFSRRELGGANASKLCLLELQRILVAGGYVLLDSQEANEHMAQFGGENIEFEEYRDRLAAAVDTPAEWVRSQ
ncbi:MAG: leucyl/phenylalanyl-tRNA--protein transferase [Phycisphaerales bacterium]